MTHAGTRNERTKAGIGQTGGGCSVVRGRTGYNALCGYVTFRGWCLCRTTVGGCHGAKNGCCACAGTSGEGSKETRQNSNAETRHSTERREAEKANIFDVEEITALARSATWWCRTTEKQRV